MKVALVFVGKPRPSIDSAISNIKLTIKNLEHDDTDSYILLEKEDFDLRYVEIIKNIITMPYLTNDEIEKSFGFNGTVEIGKSGEPGQYVRNNLFRQFYKNKLMFDFIKLTGIRYDYIFWQRMDLALDVDPCLYFTKGRYVTTAQKTGSGELITGDQMGCAEPEVMRAAWDFRDVENLNELANQSFNPEDCLKKLLAQNGVEWAWSKFKSVRLKEHPPETYKE